MTKAALGLALCLLFSGAAQAFSTAFPPESPEYRTLQKIGSQYQAVAASLGCAQFAAGGFISSGKVADLEYLPEGEVTRENWTRLTSVTVYALSGSPATDARLMNSIMQRLLESYEKAGAKIRRTEYFMAESDEPGMFVEYEIGEGAAREHNAGVFKRSAGKAAVFIQLQSRGKPLDPEDSSRVRAFIQPK
jgi:hypothetical protein